MQIIAPGHSAFRCLILAVSTLLMGVNSEAVLAQDGPNKQSQNHSNSDRHRDHQRHRNSGQSNNKDDATDHLRQAIQHLRMAGLDSEANRLEQRVQGRRMRRTPSNQRPRGDQNRGFRGQQYRRPEQAPAQQRHVDELTRSVQELQAAVHHLHERLTNSDKLAQAVDDAHRGLDELREHTDRRGDELEQHIDQQLEEFGEQGHALHQQVSRHLEELERHFVDRVRERNEKHESHHDDHDHGRHHDDDDHDDHDHGRHHDDEDHEDHDHGRHHDDEDHEDEDEG